MDTISERCRNGEEQRCEICEDKDCKDNTNPTDPVVGYWLTRTDSGGWLFAGTTSKEVAKTVQGEIDANLGLQAEECGELILKAVKVTRAEIDSLPEFEGW